METVNVNVFEDPATGMAVFLDSEGNMYEPVQDSLNGLGKFRLFKKIGSIFKKKSGGTKVGNFLRKITGKKLPVPITKKVEVKTTPVPAPVAKTEIIPNLPESDNTKYWIMGGVGVLALGGMMVALSGKKKKAA